MILLLVLFQLKHFIADWWLQTAWMVQGKRRRGWNFIQPLLAHAGLHAFLTVSVVQIATRNSDLALLAGLFDLTAHFCIDRIKSHPWMDFIFDIGNPQKKAYWLAMGTDQMCHQLTYLVIVYYIYGKI